MAARKASRECAGDEGASHDFRATLLLSRAELAMSYVTHSGVTRFCLSGSLPVPLRLPKLLALRPTRLTTLLVVVAVLLVHAPGARASCGNYVHVPGEQGSTDPAAPEQAQPIRSGAPMPHPPCS